MPESYSGSEKSSDGGRLGLADKISPAVSDYYDALFNNMDEYFGMVSDKTHADRTIDAGFALSGESLTERESQLTAHFNAAPVTEKYSYLMKHYMEEYRTKLEERVNLSCNESVEASASVERHRHDRPSALDALSSFGAANKQWAERLEALEQTAADKRKDFQNLRSYAETSHLVEIDAFQFAVEQTRKISPAVTKQYQEHSQREFRKLLTFDPIRLYDKLTMEYVNFYIADAGKKFFGLQESRDILQTRLQEHEAARPGFLKNLTTLGSAGKIWQGERDALTRKMDKIKAAMTEQHTKREECKKGWPSHAAGKDACNFIQALHPEVVEACERYVARQWEKSNAARLEQQKDRQAGGENGNEQSQDKGLSR